MTVIHTIQKKNNLKLLTCLLIAVLLSTCAPNPKPEQQITRQTTLMNTYLQIKVAKVPHEEIGEIIDGAIDLGQKLDKKLSIFNEYSELNELNLTKKMQVTDDLYEVVKLAVEISRKTNGYFDITVTPLLKKQGFYLDVPDVILEAMPNNYVQLGWEKIKFLDNNYIELDADIWMDLSGIAKGYIVDRMSKYLKEHNIGTFLVNAGGDMFCSSINDYLWKIGIISPGENKVLEVMELKNEAVATSGDYENWYIDENDKNIKVSHIADPPEGDLLNQSLSSVTVITDTCAKADALATAMMAMGSEKAIELASKDESIKIVTVNIAENGYNIRQT